MKSPPVSRRALLAGAAAGALGGTVAFGASTLKRAPDSVSTWVDSSDWPLVHHDTHNTGFNSHADGPAGDPDVRWSVEQFAPENPFRGYLNLPTPAVVGDAVYVGGSSASARRVGDGRERWSVGGDSDRTFHGVAFADGTVFLSTRRPDGAGVAAFDATGQRRWQRDVELRRAGPPLVAGTTVYVPGYDYLVALDRSSGTKRWRLETESQSVGHPVVTDARLYTPMGWQGLLARDRRTSLSGALLGDPPAVQWRYEPDERAYPSPALGGGRVFVPVSEAWYPSDAEGLGALAALDTDGTRRWTHSGGTFGTSPVVADGTVYYKCGANAETIDMGEYVQSQSDARVTAHDAADGRVRWTRWFSDLGDWQIEPVADDERLYVPLHDDVGERSALVALDAATGETRWRRTLDAPAYHLSLAGGTLYVSTTDGTLLALG
ncbi:outer membrane protein assembly factor BamB family protein [Halorussus halobius]|uniref:outer membrane protein assembly factor BamB family protein n=1 Tax=Halorussus halobius TaxID=1710537 RepID=UPI00143D8325|nr:PQQ-binding-like beta-propeller repeat protein [Halorussus halobius]